MDVFINYRIVAGVITLYLNLLYNDICLEALAEHLPDNPELQHYDNLKFRYCTTWNATIICCYITVALICDACTLKEIALPLSIKDIRLKFFHGVTFPFCGAIYMFWPIFFYDRDLILPPVTKLVLSEFGNFVFHALTIIYVYSELILLPKNDRTSEHKKMYFIYVQIAYIFVVFYTKYGDLGEWMYEIMNVTEGTIYLPMLILTMMVSPFIAYYAQWYFLDAVWTLRKNQKIEFE